MDRYSLIRGVVGFWLLLIVGMVGIHGDVRAQMVPVWLSTNPLDPSNANPVASPTAACVLDGPAIVQRMNVANPNSVYTFLSCGAVTLLGNGDNANVKYTYRACNKATPPACADNPATHGVTKRMDLCAPPNVVVGGVCTPEGTGSGGNIENCGDVGFNLGGDSVTKYTMGATGTTACYRGCVAVPLTQYGTGTNRWATGPWTSMGMNCSGSGTDGKPSNLTKDPVATACAGSTCPGTVNGVAVCVACSKTWENEVTGEKETSASGVSTGKGNTVNSVNDNGDGTVTTTTTTYHPDGTTTTTTKTGPKGEADGTPGDGIDGEDGKGFCEENPDSSICKDSSFQGSCAANFGCDGDQVQCAIAKEQHKRNCALFETTSDISDIGTASANGASSPDGHPGNSTLVTSMLFSDRIDTSNPFGSSCPADKVMSAAGASFTIPFSELCGSLQLMGAALVAICMLASVAIVFRGGK